MFFLVLNDVTYETLVFLLFNIYVGHSPFHLPFIDLDRPDVDTINNAVDILISADKYGVDEAKEVAERCLVAMVDADNAKYILQIADMYVLFLMFLLDNRSKPLQKGTMQAN
jgi:hypothetical protein